MIVEWTESALDQLADVYVTMALSDQRAMETVVQTMNSALAQKPSELGESRTSGRRIWFFESLVVIFRIVPTENLVIVSHVGKTRRK